MKQSKAFFIALAVLFGLPWMVLIVYPWVSLAGLDRVPYAQEDEVGDTYFPPVRTGLQLGPEVYARNGCAYCHTQMIRPTYAGADLWRPGWAGVDEEDRPARETQPRDFLGEGFAHLGVARIGPDLSNVGHRIEDASWHYRHLFDPRSVRPGSVMPAFRHLFTYQEVVGPVSEDAMATVEGDDGILYEYVPGPEAEALVLYLLSLRKDHPLPAQIAVAE